MSKIPSKNIQQNNNSVMVTNLNAASAQGTAFFVSGTGKMVFKPDFAKDGSKFCEEAYNKAITDAKAKQDAYRIACEAMGGQLFPDGFTQTYINQLANWEAQQYLEKTPPTNRGVFLPKSGTEIMPESRAVISFDWLSMTVKILPSFWSKKREAITVRQGNKTGHYQLWYGQTKKAELLLMQGNNQEGLATLKIENKELYQAKDKILALIHLICNDMGLKFLWFTRIDTAIDMQTTKVKGMGVQDMFDKIGKGELIFRSKITETNTELPAACKDGYQDDKIMEMLVSETHRRRGKVNTVYVGKRKSGMQICMYNKSLQMRTQKNKPWVKDAWREAGHLDGFDTYRIEFRHMKDVKEIAVVNKETGELESKGLALDNLHIINQLEMYVEALYEQHFNLAKYKKGERFSRMKRIDILKGIFDGNIFCPIRYTEKKASTNLIKNRIKHLAQHGQAAWAGGRKLNASETFKTCFAIIEQHDLNTWFSGQIDRLKMADCIQQIDNWMKYTAIAIDTEQNRVLDYYQV